MGVFGQSQAKRRVRQGQTTPEEIMRVLGEGPESRGQRTEDRGQRGIQ
jgi:hypothetical protein